MKKEKQLLQKIYGFEFPESFFQFYEFTKKVPESTFEGLSGVTGLSLGEIFDVFDHPEIKNFNPLKDSRYYNDPPEFFTILNGSTDGLHWGYYLDDLNDAKNIYVASYYSNDAFGISTVGVTIFEAFREELESQYASVVQYSSDNEEKIETLNNIRNTLVEFETGARTETGDCYLDKYTVKREIIADTRDCMGIVVPPESYRPLAGEDKFKIWNYDPTPEDVDILYKNAMTALEEGYPGTALKAGKDLWVYSEYFETTYKLLHSAYQALGRHQLCHILKIAKEYREECDRFYNRKK